MNSVNSFLFSLTLLCTVFIQDGTSSFMLADDKISECVGSIVLNDNSNLTFHSSVSNLNHVVWMVRMEGCGCFRLYQRSGGRGRSVKIEQRGITRVKFGRLGSLAREGVQIYLKKNLMQT